MADTNDDNKPLTYIIRSNTTSYGGFEGVGYISGTTLTITRTTTGILKIGDVVIGGKTIVAIGTYTALTGTGTVTISATANSASLAGSISTLGLLTVSAVDAGTTLVAGQELAVDGLPDGTLLGMLSYYTPSTSATLVNAIPQPFNTASSNNLTVSSYTGDNLFQNGDYVASASSYSGFQPWRMFYGAVANSITNDYWFTAYKGVNNYTTDAYSSSGLYVGGGSPEHYYTAAMQDGSLIAGEFVQIQLPYSLQLTTYKLYPQTGLKWSQYSPVIIYVVGSNDGTTWGLVDYQHITTYPDNENPYIFNPTTTTSSYSYFRLIINQIRNGNAVTFSDWTLTGNHLKSIPVLPVYALTKSPTVAIPISIIYIKSKYTIQNGTITATNDSTIQLFGLPSRYDKFNCEVVSFMVSANADDVKANVVELRQEGISLLDGKDCRQGGFKSIAFRNMMTDNQSTYNFICNNFNNKYIRFKLYDEYGALLLDRLNSNFSRPWILVLKMTPIV